MPPPDPPDGLGRALDGVLWAALALVAAATLLRHTDAAGPVFQAAVAVVVVVGLAAFALRTVLARRR